MTYHSLHNEPVTEPTGPEPPPLPAAAMEPINMPGRPEQRLRQAVHRMGNRFWWTLAIIVLAMAVGYSVWFARDLFVGEYVLPPGATYTDRHGVSYTVLAREELTEIDAFSLTNENIAPEGAVFLRYTVAVDNYVYIEGDDYSTVCSFDLSNGQGDAWQGAGLYDEQRSVICESEPDGITRSQLVYPVFLVPTSMLDQVAGLIPNTVPGDVPVLSEPA